MNKNNNILIVDDMSTITTQLDILLSKLGLNVTISHNASDGLNKFEKGQFAYVSVDLLLPTEKDGYELLKNLKNTITSSNINTEIVVLSARPRKEQEDICKKLGADYYIEKNEDWQSEFTKIINKRNSDENK